jgi:hypothetical protein
MIHLMANFKVASGYFEGLIIKIVSELLPRSMLDFVVITIKIRQFTIGLTMVKPVAFDCCLSQLYSLKEANHIKVTSVDVMMSVN